MLKLTLIKDQEDMGKTLGITEERSQELMKAFSTTAANITTEAIKAGGLKTGNRVVELLEGSSPETCEEAVFVSYILRDTIETIVDIGENGQEGMLKALIKAAL